MNTSWRPQDLMLHFYVEGGIDEASTFLARATGAHSFRLDSDGSYSSTHFSLSGTPYELFDHISPGLVDDSDSVAKDIVDDRIDGGAYNMHLRFPFDPRSPDELAAIIRFAAALGASTPTVLLDGDDMILYSSSPLGGEYVDKGSLPTNA